MQGKEQNT